MSKKPEAEAEEEEDDQPDPEEIGRDTQHLLLRRFMASALGFWRAGGDHLAWLLTIGMLILIGGQIYFQYRINVWNRLIFDALQQRNSDAVFTQAVTFPFLAVAAVALGVGVVYAKMTMQRRWRGWLSGHVVDQWLAHGRYYQLNIVPGDHANPEYRIAEDLRNSTEAPMEFAVGMITALVSAATFIGVLWTIGGALELPVGTTVVTIPGFLVVAALIYSLIASGTMVLIARHFVTYAERKNQAEAEYRYLLTRLRENGESIALLGGEKEERAGLDKSLGRVLRRWRALCFQNMRTTGVSQSSQLLAPVIPLILSAPKFLAGTMSLGEVMQAASAFVFVQTAFSWLVDNYPRIADWSASGRRVASLLVSLDSLREAEGEGGFGRINRDIDARDPDGAALRLKDLAVALNDGTAVVNETDVAIKPGERVLVAGESGSGKSTLVRAIAGLWPWGGGDVDIQSGARISLLPQRPYVPIGTLRRAVAYPAAADSVDKEKLAHALELVGLGHLVEQIDEDAPWDQTLSGGEKQRLAFARLLVQRPDIIVLDEATSALDLGSQDKMMEMISQELHATTILSVGHRPELERFHDRKLVLEKREGEGAADLVRDIALHARRRRRSSWRRAFRRKPRAAEAAE